MKFKPILHQFTLFDYNQLRPHTRIPIRRITRQRMKEVLAKRQGGDDKPLLQVLRNLNDDLEIYERRITTNHRNTR